MAKVWVLLVMFLAAGCTMTVNGTPVDDSTGGGGSTTTNPSGNSGTVVDVIDGDTIDVNINGTVYRVRYVGMNTPESDEVCYQEATAANAALVEGKTVTLVKDTSETDRFDRLLRYIYVGDVFVNARLVQDGFAEVVSYPPDTAQFENFKSLEITATSSGLGCHPTGIFNDGRFDR